MSQEKEKKPKKVGFIGIGRIGSALVRGFVVAKKERKKKKTVLDAKDVFATDKEGEKVKRLEEDLGIKGKEKNAALVKDSDIIFLCVEPKDALKVIDEIKDELKQDKCLVSVVAGLPVSKIKEKVKARVVAAIPTTIAEVRRGFSLVHFSEGEKSKKEEFIEKILGKIGGVIETTEEGFGAYVELTSCAPAFIAVMMDQFAEVVAERSKGVLSKEEAKKKAKETMIGTALLLLDRGISFKKLWERVETRDGITMEGTEVLKNLLPGVFKEVLRDTRKKLKEKSE